MLKRKIAIVSFFEDFDELTDFVYWLNSNDVIYVEDMIGKNPSAVFRHYPLSFCEKRKFLTHLESIGLRLEPA